MIAVPSAAMPRIRHSDVLYFADGSADGPHIGLFVLRPSWRCGRFSCDAVNRLGVGAGLAVLRAESEKLSR